MIRLIKRVLRFKVVKLPDWSYIVTVGLFLRLINLGAESLWYDEGFSAWLSGLSLDRLFAAIKGDVHPPLFYLVEWLNVRLFGASDFALRIPSAVLSVLAGLMIYKIAGEFRVNRRVRTLAGLLAVVLPGSLYYGQDARMYPLLAFLMLIAVWSAMRSNWILFAVSGIATLYTQNYAIFYLVAIGLTNGVYRTVSAISLYRTDRVYGKPYTLLQGVWDSVGWQVLSYLGIGAGYSLWIPTLLAQSKAVASNFWIQPLTLGGALYPAGVMTFGVRLPPSLVMPAYTVAIGLSIISLGSIRSWLFGRDTVGERRRQTLILLSGIVLAPAIAALLSFVWRPIYLPRALYPSSLLLCVLWAKALYDVHLPAYKLLRAVFAIVLILSVVAHYSPTQNGRFPIRDWSDTIRDNWRSGDTVYYLALDSAILFQHYLPDKPYALLPYAGDLNQSLTEETKGAMGIVSYPFESLQSRGIDRAWLILATNPLTSTVQTDKLAHILRDYPHTIVRYSDMVIGVRVIYLVDLATIQEF